MSGELILNRGAVLSSVAGSTAAVDFPELVPWLECALATAATNTANAERARKDRSKLKRVVVRRLGESLMLERPSLTPREAVAIVRRQARADVIAFASGGPSLALVREEVRAIFQRNDGFGPK